MARTKHPALLNCQRANCKRFLRARQTWVPADTYFNVLGPVRMLCHLICQVSTAYTWSPWLALDFNLDFYKSFSVVVSKSAKMKSLVLHRLMKFQVVSWSLLKRSRRHCDHIHWLVRTFSSDRFTRKDRFKEKEEGREKILRPRQLINRWYTLSITFYG